MGLFKLIAQAEKPRMVQHYLYCQYLLRDYCEKELCTKKLKKEIFNKWYKHLEKIQSQLSEDDMGIIQEIYKP